MVTIITVLLIVGVIGGFLFFRHQTGVTQRAKMQALLSQSGDIYLDGNRDAALAFVRDAVRVGKSGVEDEETGATLSMCAIYFAGYDRRQEAIDVLTYIA